MRTHQEIDARSLALAQAVARKIDADPVHEGLDRARRVCARWMEDCPSPSCREWMNLLVQPWPVVRRSFLETTEEGRRMRQNSPFCGVLTPAERWHVYRNWSRRET
jgi:hypothetical protein